MQQALRWRLAGRSFIGAAGAGTERGQGGGRAGTERGQGGSRSGQREKLGCRAAFVGASVNPMGG